MCLSKALFSSQHLDVDIVKISQSNFGKYSPKKYLVKALLTSPPYYQINYKKGEGKQLNELALQGFGTAGLVLADLGPLQWF